MTCKEKSTGQIFEYAKSKDLSKHVVYFVNGKCYSIKDFKNKFERCRYDIEHYKSKQDKDGYTTFQAWSFMQIFGNSIVFGGDQLFGNNILIQVDDKV